MFLMMTIGILFGIYLLVKYIEKINGCSGKQVDKYDLVFNEEFLTGRVLVLDERTESQRQRNKASGQLDGDVIVFLHGHGQLPWFGFEFIKELAQKSASGIVVVPHVYTPHGRLKSLRGDKGKLLILKALVRRSLIGLGIAIPFHESDNLVKFVEDDNGNPCSNSDDMMPNADKVTDIDARLTIVGWSHGGLMARHFAYAYPEVVSNLGQITPAGFEPWGHQRWAGINLTVHFLIEVAIISTMLFKGEIKHPLIAGWAILRGTIGDSLNAIRYYTKGWRHPAKLLRAYQDIKECSIVADDSNLPVNGLKNIVVIYGKKDSVFEAKNALPGVDLNRQVEAQKALFSRFYPSAVAEGTRCSLSILPGNHIAPLVFQKEYVDSVLKGTEQHSF